MPVLVELQGCVLRRVCERVEGRVSHVRGGEMVMLMLMVDHVRGGEVAEGRGVLMEIRGKHGCDLVSVSTKIPPLSSKTSSQKNKRMSSGVSVSRAWQESGEASTRLRAGCQRRAGVLGLCREGRREDMQVICPTVLLSVRAWGRI